LLSFGGIGLGVTGRIAQPQPRPKKVPNDKNRL
jgi:hypothetical protein